MRKYPNRLLEIIQNSDVNLNSISKLSGISNTYLTKLSKGQINHPGKDKIASILLALNFPITEINKVLAEYDYQGLNKHDIPSILANNRKRKVEGKMLPHYDRLYFELMLAAFEHIGGTKVLVKNRPSGIYQPYRLYMMKEFPAEVDGEATRFLYEMTGQVVRERLSLFVENCKNGNKVINYICRSCLEESLERELSKCVAENDMAKLELIAQYYANAASCAIKFPDQHFIHIVERCSTFEFLIQDAESERPKINFTGSSHHSFNNPYDQHNLEGFSTDSASILRLFNLEIEMCKAAINRDDSRNTPEGFRKYIHAKFAQHSGAHFFEKAMDELMATDEIKLF